jgi:hypothetical protein
MSLCSGLAAISVMLLTACARQDAAPTTAPPAAHDATIRPTLRIAIESVAVLSRRDIFQVTFAFSCDDPHTVLAAQDVAFGPLGRDAAESIEIVTEEGRIHVPRTDWDDATARDPESLITCSSRMLPLLREVVDQPAPHRCSLAFALSEPLSAPPRCIRMTEHFYSIVERRMDAHQCRPFVVIDTRPVRFGDVNSLVAER